MQATRTHELEERPPDYVGPSLNPDGLILESTELGDGVYALLANEIPKDNNGVIIGADAVLVIDAGINGDISRQIQARVRELTDSPIRYLVNTTYHGDHTFGNDAFPDTVTIISSTKNKECMVDLAREKQMREGNLHGNENALADVTDWRRPDVVFERYAEIELGSQSVELWHFGPGNGPGDTIVYVPSVKVAWTGNFLPRAGIPPMLLNGEPGPYIESLRAMKETIDVDTIVCGHGPMGEGEAALDSLIEYLEGLQLAVREAIAAGCTLEETLETTPLPEDYGVPNVDELNQTLQQMHRLNVLATYRTTESE